MLPLGSSLLDRINGCKDITSFKKIHALLLRSDVIFNDSVANRAAEFFGQSVNFVDYGCKFFKQCHQHSSSFPFNRLILNYASTDRPQAAVSVYRRLTGDGFVPDPYTFPAVLKPCGKFTGLREGKQLHGVVLKMGFMSDPYVGNSLFHFYSACADSESAREVFDEMPVRDVVSWNGIVSGYVKAGLFDEALDRFMRMDVEPNVATYVSVLGACGRKRYLGVGKGIHGLFFKHTFGDSLQANNALIDMYVKCGFLREAKQVFYELGHKDIFSWTSIISGLVQCKYSKEALELFWKMESSGVEPDRVILTSVLSACASLGALDYGRWVHDYIDRKAFKWDIQVGTAMVDMYAKCGCIDIALHTFNQMSSKNVRTWNVLLNGLAMHGHGHEAINLFEEMVKAGMEPNQVTFLAILTACCHSGLVHEGQWYFGQMISQHYNLTPGVEHYGCMVDLLCRAGFLDKALDLVKSMPMLPDMLIIGAILTACKANGSIQLSGEILDHLVELETHDSGAYVLLSNIYAANQRWADVNRIRRLMKGKRIKKAPGSSVIEIDGNACEFVVEDMTHTRNGDIRITLEFLAHHIFLEGQHLQQFLL